MSYLNYFCRVFFGFPICAFFFLFFLKQCSEDDARDGKEEIVEISLTLLHEGGRQ